MDLDEYLWRNKIKKKTFAKKVSLTPHGLSCLVARKVSPKLHTAINIVDATDGQVTYIELLRPEDWKMIENKDIMIPECRKRMTYD